MDTWVWIMIAAVVVAVIAIVVMQQRRRRELRESFGPSTSGRSHARATSARASPN